MGYTAETFRRTFPVLVHYAPKGFLRRERGLLTAAQLLDHCADVAGSVWTRFQADAAFKAWPVDHWKTHSRFRRRAGSEAGSNLLVRDAEDETTVYVLGNNYPLGQGTCLGTTIPLTHNRPGDPTPSSADWFRLLNDMFWVFHPQQINDGVLKHLRAATPTGLLSRLEILTVNLPDDFIEERIRLSAINGGGSNGCSPRGTATYERPSEWKGTKAPKEIGILNGVSQALMARMDLRLEDA